MKNNSTTAPSTAINKLVRLKPLIAGPPSKLDRKPPMNAPTIPIIMFAKAPCSALVFIIIDAIHPANAPNIIQRIMFILFIPPRPSSSVLVSELSFDCYYYALLTVCRGL